MSYAQLMQKVAHAAPKHYDFLLKTAAEVKSSPFKDEITSELDGLMKKAFQMPGWAGSMGKSLAGGAGMVGGAVAAGIAYSLAGDMYDATKRGITKSRNYKAMLQANPDLKEMEAKKVQTAFSVLHRFNPEFSADPTVAGAWVKRQATYGEDSFGDTRQLKELIDSRKTLGDINRLPQVPNFNPRTNVQSDEKHREDMNKKKFETTKAKNMSSASEHVRDTVKTRAETEALRHGYYANLQQP